MTSIERIQVTDLFDGTPEQFENSFGLPGTPEGVELFAQENGADFKLILEGPTTHKTTIRAIGPNLVHVTCSRGCELGSSAIQPTIEKAKTRAKLHELAQSYYIATLEN